MNSKMDPMGRAIADYHNTKKASKLRVFSPMFEEDEIPLTTLFRSYKSMPEIERKALDMAKGRVLDVGAGSGCHSLVLQERGLGMKWTVLSDNRTCNNQFQTEHGLSILLETEKHCILLDTGASDVYIRNAEKMGIDLSEVDYVFISHGHSDHAGGLKHFMHINDKAKIIVSPDALKGKFYSKRQNLHGIITEWPEIPSDRLVTVDRALPPDTVLHQPLHGRRCVCHFTSSYG